MMNKRESIILEAKPSLGIKTNQRTGKYYQYIDR